MCVLYVCLFVCVFQPSSLRTAIRTSTTARCQLLWWRTWPVWPSCAFRRVPLCPETAVWKNYGPPKGRASLVLSRHIFSLTVGAHTCLHGGNYVSLEGTMLYNCCVCLCHVRVLLTLRMTGTSNLCNAWLDYATQRQTLFTVVSIMWLSYHSAHI